LINKYKYLGVSIFHGHLYWFLADQWSMLNIFATPIWLYCDHTHNDAGVHRTLHIGCCLRGQCITMYDVYQCTKTSLPAACVPLDSCTASQSQHKYRTNQPIIMRTLNTANLKFFILYNNIKSFQFDKKKKSRCIMYWVLKLRIYEEARPLVYIRATRTNPHR
jgi:hypothetical protein